jgi:putative ABC transport system permease protein
VRVGASCPGFRSNLLTCVGIYARDPVTFATVAAVVALAALMACSIPAARAVRVDPTIAMRTE